MYDALMQWLKTHGPDDWHKVVINWNWDYGYGPLSWIASQPDCDRATAQYLIVVGEVAVLIHYPNRDVALASSPSSLEGFDFMVDMVARWNAGFYIRNEIASVEPEFIEEAAKSYRFRKAGGPKKAYRGSWTTASLS